MPRANRQEWRNRIQRYGELSPDEIIANPDNWRTHPPEQLLALEGALESIGWVQDVLINTVTGHMVDGHARVLLAKKHHQPSVPVKYVSLTPEEERQVLLTLDPITTLANANSEMLNRLLADFHPRSDKLSGLVTSLQAAANQALSQQTTTTDSEGSSSTTSSETSGPELPANLDSNYHEQYGVIVICADEAEQEMTYADLQAAGYEHLKVVTT